MNNQLTFADLEDVGTDAGKLWDAHYREVEYAAEVATLMQTAGDEAISTDDVLWLLSDTLHDVRLAAKAVLYRGRWRMGRHCDGRRVR